MSRDRDHLSEGLYQRARVLHGAAREDFVRESCGDDAELRRRVLALLADTAPKTAAGRAPDTLADVPQESPRRDASAWVGRRLGRYEVTRVIESGGMGCVFEAHDATIDRRVAIKMLHADLSVDEPMRERFLAEARAAGGINHPNVITIHEVSTEGDAAYLVMEYAEGGSASSHVASEGPYSVADATRLLCEACRGLAAAHAVGLVHRDVKPANLLLTGRGVVKVSDFGTAKLLGGESLQLTRQGQIVGTPHYMSPEQCEGKAVDPRSDVYSLGATYYSLLVGRTPYGDRDSLVSVIAAHCHAEPPDPRAIDASVPDACAAIIERAMHKSPNGRYQSAEELLYALKGLDPGVLHNKVIAPPPTRLTRRALVAGGATLLASAGALAFYASRPRAASPSNEADLASTTPPVFTNAEPLRVGVLHSLSGTMAHNEEVLVDAAMLAVDELNARGGVLGRRVETVVVDGRSDEDDFAAGAERLVNDERVNVIFGCCTSASRKAVRSVVEEHDHLLVYSVNTEGVETSPNIVYLGGDPTQTVIPCVRWAYAFGQKRTFFLVGSDYVFPRVVNEILKDQLASMGAKLVGEEYLPLGSTRVESVIGKIKAAGPDAIINTISGDTLAPFVRELRAADVTATQFATGIGERELRSANIALFVGDYSISTYFQSIDTAQNRAFVGRFQDRFGKQRVINASLETTYAAVGLWASAVEQAGRAEPAAIRQSISGQRFHAPGGALFLDSKTHYAFRNSYIGRVEPTGQFEVVWQSPNPIAPEPYPDTRSHADWDRLLSELHEGWGGRWSASATSGASTN